MAKRSKDRHPSTPAVAQAYLLINIYIRRLLLLTKEYLVPMESRLTSRCGSETILEELELVHTPLLGFSASTPPPYNHYRKQKQ